MSFATKLCHMVYADGARRDVMKYPKTDSSKFSLPGGGRRGAGAGPGRGRGGAGAGPGRGRGGAGAGLEQQTGGSKSSLPGGRRGARAPLSSAGVVPSPANPRPPLPVRRPPSSPVPSLPPACPSGRPPAPPSPAGVLAVKRVGGVPTVFPADSGEVALGEDLLQVRGEVGMVRTGRGARGGPAAGEGAWGGWAGAAGLGRPGSGAVYPLQAAGPCRAGSPGGRTCCRRGWGCGLGMRRMGR
jgi:hypothetical protein